MKKYFSLVKFSHTIFALPFALLGFFLALQSVEVSHALQKLLLMLGCMVTGRNAAMSFNRLVDRNIDSHNERTSSREIPSGVVTLWEARLFVIVNICVFICLTYFINSLCFYLSPVALIIILGYSYTKRFTWLCHLVLGLGLGLAPVGAYITLTGQFHILPIAYGVAVMFWVAGFDVIYALQDADFDTQHHLRSIPSVFERQTALRISVIFHVLSSVVIVISGILLQSYYPGAHPFHWIGITLFIVFLFYQHTLITPTDLSKVNAAFFTSNGIASVVFGGLGILDFLLFM